MIIPSFYRSLVTDLTKKLQDSNPFTKRVFLDTLFEKDLSEYIRYVRSAISYFANFDTSFQSDDQKIKGQTDFVF